MTPLTPLDKKRLMITRHELLNLAVVYGIYKNGEKVIEKTFTAKELLGLHADMIEQYIRITLSRELSKALNCLPSEAMEFFHQIDHDPAHPA